MANLKQCPNGHYYYDDLNECPYCSGGMSMPVGSFIDDAGNTAPINGGGFDVIPPTLPAQNELPTSPNVNGLPKTYPVEPVTIGAESFTKPVWPMKKKNEKEEQEKEQPEKYVVGWLVAVSGPYCGQSFELHHLYNHIGREAGDIVLKKDPAVSKENNLSVLYDHVKNDFYIGAGTSTNIVRINGDVLFNNENKPLIPYDLIEVGHSEFRFVPFCSDKFQWMLDN